MPDLYFWIIAVLAVFIVALSKSGLVGSLGLVAVPMLSLVMPARDAAGMMLPLRKKLEGLPPSKPWGIFWGGFAGFTSFISHTGGPPFQIYVLPQRLAPAIYSGTSAFFFAIVNSAKLIPYFFLGQLNVANLSHAAILAPLAIVGVLIGVWLVRRISIKRFYQITYWLVFLLAIKLIVDGVQAVFFTGAVA